MTYVLDSWAVLRLLEGAEPAASLVQAVLDAQRPLMSWVNLGEVFSVVHRDHGHDEAQQVVRDVQSQVDAELPTEQRVLQAALVKAEHPLAYADAFAAATALAHDAALLTGDPELLASAATWRVEDLRSPSKS